MKIACAMLVVTAFVFLVIALASNSPSGLAQSSQVSPTSTPLPDPYSEQYAQYIYVGQDNDDEPDVLLMALLTVGVAGGAAVVGLIGYVIRNRVGFWLHRPPPREGGAPEEHH